MKSTDAKPVDSRLDADVKLAELELAQRVLTRLVRNPQPVS